MKVTPKLVIGSVAVIGMTGSYLYNFIGNANAWRTPPDDSYYPRITPTPIRRPAPSPTPLPTYTPRSHAVSHQIPRIGGYMNDSW